MSLCIVGNIDKICSTPSLVNVLDSFRDKTETFTAECTSVHDAVQVAKKAGPKSTVILGDIDTDCAPILKEFLDSGLNVLIDDVFACTTTEWQELENVAKRQNRKLFCRSQTQRFNPKLIVDTPANNGTIVINAYNQDTKTGVEQTFSVPIDVAMFLQNSSPQVIFASRKGEYEHKDTKSYNGAVMMRFKGGVSALLASSIIQSKNMDTTSCDMLEIDIHKSTKPDSFHITQSDFTKNEVSMLEYMLNGSLPDFADISFAKSSIEQYRCSKISRINDAIAVSINTGAPVYIE